MLDYQFPMICMSCRFWLVKTQINTKKFWDYLCLEAECWKKQTTANQTLFFPIEARKNFSPPRTVWHTKLQDLWDHPFLTNKQTSFFALRNPVANLVIPSFYTSIYFRKFLFCTLTKMGDLDDYDFSKTDAGASHVYNEEAGQIRVGGWVFEHSFYIHLLKLNI